jgi:hypothetical protein
MPLHMPRAVIIAALLPRAIPWLRTKMLSGPGAMVRAADAPRKQRSVVEVIRISFPLLKMCRGDQKKSGLRYLVREIAQTWPFSSS